MTFRDKDRIISKPVIPALQGSNPAFNLAGAGARGPIRLGIGDAADKTCRPLPQRDTLKITKQFSHIVLIRGTRTCISGRIHPRKPSQGINNQPRVIRKSRQSGMESDGTCLFQCIGPECRSVLLNFRAFRKLCKADKTDVPPLKKTVHLFDFLAVSSCKDDVHRPSRFFRNLPVKSGGCYCTP